MKFCIIQGVLYICQCILNFIVPWLLSLHSLFVGNATTAKLRKYTNTTNSTLITFNEILLKLRK
jgi:hypothetical protein